MTVYLKLVQGANLVSQIAYKMLTTFVFSFNATIQKKVSTCCHCEGYLKVVIMQVKFTCQ